jgi:hypothetical protein
MYADAEDEDLRIGKAMVGHCWTTNTAFINMFFPCDLLVIASLKLSANHASVKQPRSVKLFIPAPSPPKTEDIPEEDLFGRNKYLAKCAELRISPVSQVSGKFVQELRTKFHGAQCHSPWNLPMSAGAQVFRVPGNAHHTLRPRAERHASVAQCPPGQEQGVC